jgi:hypothetical protein
MRMRVMAALSAILLVGCAAQIENNLRRESASVIAPTPYPDSVVLSDVHRDRLGNPTKWVATTRSGVYDCSKESGEYRPICAKRGSEPRE